MSFCGHSISPLVGGCGNPGARVSASSPGRSVKVLPRILPKACRGGKRPNSRTNNLAVRFRREECETYDDCSAEQSGRGSQCTCWLRPLFLRKRDSGRALRRVFVRGVSQKQPGARHCIALRLGSKRSLARLLDTACQPRSR
jgi:hypothetical protein